MAKTVSGKIRLLKKEGKPQKQAVAIALDMKKRGQLSEAAPLVAGLAHGARAVATGVGRGAAAIGRVAAKSGKKLGGAAKTAAKDAAAEVATNKMKEKLKGELTEDLRKWVAEKWVDIGAPKKGGGYKPCGRQKGEKRKGYPKCVPSSKAASMSKSQKRSAVQRKRAAGNTGPKPTNVKTMKEYRVVEGKLCPKGKAAAKRKFKVYPSAYANMYASAVCSGKVTPGGKKGKKKKSLSEHLREAKSPAWQRKAGKNPEGGLNQKGVASYRAANPGSKLKTAVTKDPSKLKKGSKAAKRRKSFCARMSGMKKRLTSAKTANDPDSRINKSLRKWNC